MYVYGVYVRCIFFAYVKFANFKTCVSIKFQKLHFFRLRKFCISIYKEYICMMYDYDAIFMLAETLRIHLQNI